MKTFVGTVTSVKMDKTAVVEVMTNGCIPFTVKRLRKLKNT